jgi:O-antigen ligase
LAAFALPLPTAWGSFALAFLLTIPLLRGQWNQQWIRLRSVRSAWLALALLGLYLLGAAYSSAPSAQVSNFLGKYAKLLIIPILVASLDSEKWRRRAIGAFLVAAIIATAVSYARFFGLLPLFPDTNQPYAAFQNRITFGTYLAFATYLFTWRSIHDRSQRWMWATLALVSGVCVLMVNNARTGYVIVFALVILLFFRKYRFKGVALGMLTVAVIGTVAMTASPIGRERVMRTIQHFETYEAGKGAKETSTGLRLEFYKYSFKAILKHPWLGSGTGSFPSEYAKAIAGSTDVRTSNPHNEYLLTLVQLGLLGLAVLLLLGQSIWTAAQSLHDPNKASLEALLVTIGVGCLFNSQLLDAGEGRFFVVFAGLLLSGVADSKLKSTPDRSS